MNEWVKLEAALSALVETASNQTQAIRAGGREQSRFRDEVTATLRTVIARLDDLAAGVAVALAKPKPNGEQTGKFKLLGEEVEVTNATQQKIGAIAIRIGIKLAMVLGGAALGWLAYHLGLHPR